MTMILKTARMKGSKRRGKPATRRAQSTRHGAAGNGREKTLEEINRWMEENAEVVMKVARQNTLRLTGKEVL